MISGGVFGRALSRCRHAVWIGCAFSLFISVSLLAIPIYSLQLFERVATSGSVATLVALLGITAFFVLIQSGLDFVRSQVLRHSALQLDYQLSPALLLDAIDHAGQSQAKSQGLTHLNRVCGFLSGNIVTSMLELPWTPLFLIVLAMLHPALLLVVAAGIGLMALASKLASAAQSIEGNGDIAKGLSAYLKKSHIILSMGMGPALSMRWRDQNAERLQEFSKNNAKQQGVAVLFRFIKQLTQMLVLAAGIYLVLLNQLSMGGVIAASMIASRALMPFEPLFQRLHTLGQIRSSWQELIRLGQQIDSQDSRLPLPRPRGDLLMNNVSYIPPGSKLPQLKQVGFRLHAGQTLAIMGPSASGKSTLVSLLLGVIRPTAGEIRIDGASLNQWTPETLGQHLGYLPQDVELIEGTVSENIGRFGEANEQLVLEASQAAGVHELITGLPQGYETQVGEGGYPLSSGQKQRIALARAMYGSPSILILDEPISNIDMEGEQALSRVLERCKRLCTTVVMVTHAPSLINQSDWIICLQQGTVVKAGSREKVLGQMQVARVKSKEEAL